jgi:hypothetical protein
LADAGIIRHYASPNGVSKYLPTRYILICHFRESPD